MVDTVYAGPCSMREARAQYFVRNGFGEDGGYNDPWVTFKLGPLPLSIPNTNARKRAVAYHDLHHIITGYGTDYVGEFEISAWEIGAGCRNFYAAWVINLGGVTAGLFCAPVRTFRALRLGRRSRSLYGGDLEELLDQTVAQTRAQSGLHPPPPETTEAKDVLLFLLAAATGIGTGSLMFVGGLSVVILSMARRAAAGGRVEATE